MPDGYLPRFYTREGLVLPGERRRLTVPAPAAGADWSVAVPAGRQWRILGGHSSLTTDVTVANRFPGLQVLVDTVPVFIAQTGTAVVASSGRQVTYEETFNLAPAVSVGAVQPVRAPTHWLQPGDVLGSITGNLDVGDQYGITLLDIEELWIDNQELTKLTEEDLAAAGIQPTPWGAAPAQTQGG